MTRLLVIVAALVLLPTIPALAEGDCQADLNGDGATNQADAEIFEASLGSNAGDANYLASADFDGNGAVTVSDFAEFLARADCAAGR